MYTFPVLSHLTQHSATVVTCVRSQGEGQQQSSIEFNVAADLPPYQTSVPREGGVPNSRTLSRSSAMVA
jgi:hypothetical protein